jgi:hypothetical protein
MGRLLDSLLTLVAAVAAAYGLGELFVWLWAPAPTPENSSPPPEAFLFMWGALIGFAAVVATRIFIARRRSERGS